MFRLSRFLVFCLFLFLSSHTFSESARVSKLEVLTEVSKALGELGDSIVKITDGIKHIVVTGGEGVSFVFAKKTKNDLKELSAESTQFAISQNAKIVESIDEYLLNPSKYDWPFVQKKLSDVLLLGTELLMEWNEERSDFIVEASYEKLLDSLNSRISILEKIKSMEAPTTEEELGALSEVNKKYKALINNFREAIRELNTYIKANA